ncbi:MAG: pilus assembly protein TadE, partial [Mycobacteriales bacterium]
AARHAPEGPSVACSVAARVAAAQDARLDVCQVAGGEVTVEVTVHPPGRLGGWGLARGRARAGPQLG